MYDNISKKMKSMAKNSCMVGIIFSLVVGLIMLTMGGLLSLLGIAVAALGSFASWRSSLNMYVYGEMLDLLIDIRDGNKPSKNKKTGTIEGQDDGDDEEDDFDKWTCVHCGHANDYWRTICTNCSKEK